MKRFKFRLQSVLEQRERLEKQAVNTHAQAKKAVAEAEATLADLKALNQDLIEGLLTLRLAGSIDPQEQVFYQDYIKRVRADIVLQQQQIVQLCAVAETFRQAVVCASQEKKAVDKLREISLTAHHNETKRVEQNETDEIATMRHQFRKESHRAA